MRCQCPMSLSTMLEFLPGGFGELGNFLLWLLLGEKLVFFPFPFPSAWVRTGTYNELCASAHDNKQQHLSKSDNKINVSLVTTVGVGFRQLVFPLCSGAWYLLWNGELAVRHKANTEKRLWIYWLVCQIWAGKRSTKELHPSSPWSGQPVPQITSGRS